MPGWNDIRLGVAGSRESLHDALRQPERRQLELLQQILSRNLTSRFGKRYDFESIDSIADFQSRVPLHGYDDLRDDIDAMMAGEAGVLCSDEVALFEATGGSTGGSKFIPFTEASFEAIRGAVVPWLDDLLTTRPRIMEGRAYWSISPATRQRAHTAGGTPIGIDNDAIYFGANIAESIVGTLAVPASVGSIESVEQWRFVTLCQLLACRDLSFVSVWSPTFFLQLLDAVPDNAERIVQAIRTGRLPDEHWVAGADQAFMAADASRAAELNRLLAAKSICWSDIWPGLDLISCWRSATSRRYADVLSERFPQTVTQGKGLLATEAVVTLPLFDACSPVLAVSSAFFEFLTDDGDVLLLGELEIGHEYVVVVSTAGGLYRYRLGDRVVVTGWHEATPCLEYIGREGAQSDLCGEKLTGEFVEKALGEIPGFGFLVPVSAPRPGYLLLLDAALVSAAEQQSLADRADQALKDNPQYRYARDIEQLKALEARRVDDPVGTFERICVASGQRLGDIKPTALAGLAWAEQYFLTADRSNDADPIHVFAR